MVAVGLAIPRPAMSGAEPWTDSKYAQPSSPKFADGASPRPPAVCALRRADLRREVPGGAVVLHRAPAPVSEVGQQSHQIGEIAFPARVHPLAVLADDDVVEPVGVAQRRPHAGVEPDRPDAAPG